MAEQGKPSASDSPDYSFPDDLLDFRNLDFRVIEGEPGYITVRGEYILFGEDKVPSPRFALEISTAIPVDDGKAAEFEEVQRGLLVAFALTTPGRDDEEGANDDGYVDTEEDQGPELILRPLVESYGVYDNLPLSALVVVVFPPRNGDPAAEQLAGGIATRQLATAAKLVINDRWLAFRDSAGRRPARSGRAKCNSGQITLRIPPAGPSSTAAEPDSTGTLKAPELRVTSSTRGSAYTFSVTFYKA